QTEGTLCVRFYRRRDGSILTRNCTVGMQAIKDKLTSTRAHIIAAILSFLGYLGVLGLSSRVVISDFRYPVVTGALVPAPDRGLVTQSEAVPAPDRGVPQSEAVIRQRAIFKVIPMYHSTGRNRPHGIVTVRVTIDQDGTVANAESI